MAKNTINQKLFRMLKLLRAVKTPWVGRLMAARGFGPEDLDEGWDLLRRGSGMDIVLPGPASVFKGSIAELIAESMRRISQEESIGDLFMD